MQISTRQLVALVAIAAIVASAMTSTLSALVNPPAAGASDAQITRAVNTMRKDLLRTIGDSEYDDDSLRGQVKAMCVALGGRATDC